MLRNSICIALLSMVPTGLAAQDAPAPAESAVPAATETPQLVPLEMPLEAPKASAKAGVKARTTTTVSVNKPRAAAPAAKPTASPQDIDLWAFTSASAQASGKSLAEFKALPGFASEQSLLLNGDLEATEVKDKPKLVTLNYSNGLRVRVIDYGTQAFVSQVRVTAPGRALKDNITVGSSRAEVETSLGAPTRGSGSYAVYQGSTDTVRFSYANDVVTAVEIDRGS